MIWTMTTTSNRREDKRTTVSLAQVVWQMAEEMMAKKGFNDNFSAYVADLIRRDREREEEKSLRSTDPGGADLSLREQSAPVSLVQKRENDEKALALLKKSVAGKSPRPKQQ